MNFNFRSIIILLLFGMVAYIVLAVGAYTKFFPFNIIQQSNLNKKVSSLNMYTGKTILIEKFDNETKKDFDNFWRNQNVQGEINYENKLNIYY